jgi:Ca-activated chloride channel family protein
MIFRKFADSTIAAVALFNVLAATSAARAAEPITLTAKLAQPVMKSGGNQTNYLRIGLNGCEPQHKADRTPVNVAFVIDRSGSMAGARIAQAREAAIMAIKRLNDDDIASVVIFDDRVEVPVPAQKVADQGYFIGRIRQIGVRGNTAIHDGVTAGASEVRKHKDARHLNRVVLLSDGQANVGPTLPADFAALGRTLLAEGISVSTIGLGVDYNEDLMLQLARAADGNHAFASAPTDLVQIFNREFDDVLASCAQTVSIDVELKPGVRAVRALSRDGKIEDAHASFQLNQIYAATEHYVLMEVAFDTTTAADERDVGVVHVAYTAADTGARQTLDAPIRARFGASEQDVAASADKTVMESVIEQTVRERTDRAVALRDKGLSAEARALLSQNTSEIGAFLANNPSAALTDLSKQYDGMLMMLSKPSEWHEQRKVLRQMDVRGAKSGTRY